MTQTELNRYFCSFLNLDDFAHCDPSKNGLQVQNNGAAIQKVAFAVDACLQTIEKAARAEAGMLFVHHGLFWGDEHTITGSHYERIAALIKNNIALYACHLPLDAHPEAGNNAQLAKRLELQNLRPFGEFHGIKIGFMGEFAESVTINTVLQRLFTANEKPLTVLPFGKTAIKTAAIISGGAGDDIVQAIEAGADIFISGEIAHEQYHTALENKINVIAGGHYQTETVGVQYLAQKLAQETDCKTLFIADPTGL